MNHEIHAAVQEYFVLAYGDLIPNHTELLSLFVVQSIRHENHPHHAYTVCISRRSLKHFVESRKRDLGKNHTEKYMLDMILFSVDSILEVITNFDYYEYEPPIKHFYTKEYSNFGKPSIRILVHIQNDVLEIVSIHFKKTKKRI